MNMKVMEIINLLNFIRSEELKKSLDRLEEKVTRQVERTGTGIQDPAAEELIRAVQYQAEHRTPADIFNDSRESARLYNRIRKNAGNLLRLMETHRMTLETIQGFRIYKAAYFLYNSLGRILGRPRRPDPVKQARDSLLKTDSALKGIQDDLFQLTVKQTRNIPLGPYLFDGLPGRTAGMITVIAIHDNNTENLTDFLRSLQKYIGSERLEVIIARQDKTLAESEILRDEIPGLQVKITGTGMRFSTAYLRNMAAEQSAGEYLLFLDANIVFTGEVIGSLMRTLDDNPGAGIAGPAITTAEDGQTTSQAVSFSLVNKEVNPALLSPLAHPFILHETIRPGGAKSDREPKGVTTRVSYFEPVASNPPETGIGRTVVAIDGRALFCRADDFFQVGGFDLNYIGGMESPDLCLKFKTMLHKETLVVNVAHMMTSDRSGPAWLARKDDEVFYHDAGVLRNRFGYYLKCTDPGRQPVAVSEKKFRVALKLPMSAGERPKFWGDYHFAVSLKNALEHLGHSTRLDMFDEWYRHDFSDDDLVIVIRGNRRYYPARSHLNILWNISTPEMMTASEFNEYDHVFVASTTFAEKMKARARTPVEPLLQCTDPSLFHTDNSTMPANAADVLFVGNTRGVRRKILDYALKTGLAVDVYGLGWEEYLPAGYLKGNYIENQDLRKYYSNCKILLNDHWDDMAEYGFVSNRIYDALACEAVVLTDRVNGFEEELAAGVNFYGSADEMAAQVRYILDHYDEAKDRARDAGKIVMERHTFLNRAEKIIGAARKAHRARIMDATDGISEPENSDKR